MKAHLKLVRKLFTPKSTQGELYLNNDFICYTLEDFDRLSIGQPKVYGETAIPKGTYKVIINESKRFKKELPLLLDVPGFDGIRIHSGNTTDDTHGCVLVGLTKGIDRVEKSNMAMNILMQELLGFTEYEITIENEKSIA